MKRTFKGVFIKIYGVTSRVVTQQRITGSKLLQRVLAKNDERNPLVRQRRLNILKLLEQKIGDLT